MLFWPGGHGHGLVWPVWIRLFPLQALRPTPLVRGSLILSLLWLFLVETALSWASSPRGGALVLHAGVAVAPQFARRMALHSLFFPS